MMECVNVKYIKVEKTDQLEAGYNTVLYKGSYLGFIWEIHPYGRSRMMNENKKLVSKFRSADKNGGVGYFIQGIDDQKIAEKSGYIIDSNGMTWEELKSVYRLLNEKHTLPSYDIAIKTDNYIRKHINTLGKRRDKLGYRDQKGHREAYNSNDFDVKFVFGDNVPTEEVNSDCKKFQEWDRTEKEIIDLLYTNGMKDNYNIQNFVKKWFGY